MKLLRISSDVSKPGLYFELFCKDIRCSLDFMILTMFSVDQQYTYQRKTMALGGIAQVLSFVIEFHSSKNSVQEKIWYFNWKPKDRTETCSLFRLFFSEKYSWF